MIAYGINIKKLEHVFLQVDIVNEYDQILEHAKDANVFINATNIYLMILNHILNKFKVHNFTTF